MTEMVDDITKHMMSFESCASSKIKDIINNANNKKQPIIISIEGNIGSGKSTVLNYLKDFYKNKSNIGNVCFLDEPIELWNTIKDSNGVTILEKFYSNIEKYAFSFQIMAYISRLSIFRKAIKQNHDVIITERSIFTDCNIFAQMLYDDKKIEEVEYLIYKKWFEEFLDELPTINYIYIKAEPVNSYKRVLKRGRQGETITLEYLEKCHSYHEKWLHTIKGNNRVFDANCDINENPHILDNWLQSINDFIITLLHSRIYS
jgi:deoxyadenosine/deoxycytidine kinase